MKAVRKMRNGDGKLEFVDNKTKRSRPLRKGGDASWQSLQNCYEKLSQGNNVLMERRVR